MGKRELDLNIHKLELIAVDMPKQPNTNHNTRLP